MSDVSPISSGGVEYGVLFYIIVFAAVGAAIAFVYAFAAKVKERRKPK